jgi:lysophospholipase L1-like esterase
MIPRVMSEEALPAIEAEPDLIAIVDAMLDKKPPPEDLHARFYSPKAVAARARRDARRRDDDWPNLSRYRAANAAVAGRPDLVMIGDSLTEIWQLAMPEMFGERIVNRGISGQTSPQILLRFMADVVELKPRAVHVLCGTNDIAGNTGPNLAADYQRNIRAMTELAVASGIKVLLGSLTPANRIHWQSEARPQNWIPHLNRWLEDFARSRGHCFVDYHASLDDGTGGLQDRYSADGVHVTRQAYREMSAMLGRAAGFAP